MRARCEVDTYEIDGKDMSGATVGPRPAVIVESSTHHAHWARIRIGDTTAVVNTADMIRALQAASAR